MRREERLEAMGVADGDALVALADEVLGTFEIEVTRGPTVGLLMVRVEEPELRQMEIILPMAKMLAGGAAEHDLDRP